MADGQLHTKNPKTGVEYDLKLKDIGSSLHALTAALEGVTDGTYIGDIKFGEALPAGEAHIGQISGHTSYVTVTPVLDTNIYADEDILFDGTEIANAVRAVGGTATLVSVAVIDKDDQAGAFDLYFWSDAVDMGTVNLAVTIDDTNAAYYQGHVSIAAADYKDLINSQVACLKSSDLGIILKAGAASTSLYMSAVSQDAKTYTASGLVFKLGFFQD